MSNGRDSPDSAASRVLNAFSPSEASRIVGLSMHMLNYLARHRYLVPHYVGSGRGSRRHYSYRDLLVARIIARLLSAGVEISRLKSALRELGRRSGWLKVEQLGLLVTDGRHVYQMGADGTLSDLTSGGQLTFAFVLDLEHIRGEVVSAMDDDRRDNFAADNRRLIRSQTVTAPQPASPGPRSR